MYPAVEAGLCLRHLKLQKQRGSEGKDTMYYKWDSQVQCKTALEELTEYASQCNSGPPPLFPFEYISHSEPPLSLLARGNSARAAKCTKNNNNQTTENKHISFAEHKRSFLYGRSVQPHCEYILHFK